jgi:Tol biopolymer transport system component
LIGVAVVIGITAGPAAAADPRAEELIGVRGERPVRLVPDGPKLNPDGLEIQAAPGANGKIVYSRAPFLAWPASTWTMEGNGAAQTQLKAGGTGQGDNFPAWSPGGTLVAFTRDPTSSTTDVRGDIYVMRQDGSQVQRLTNTTAANYSPAWSPDGSRIAFASNRSGNFEIYTMRVDGSDVRRLTNHAADDAAPTWSPDGTRIVFESTRTGNGDIYSMTPSGSGVTRLTTSADAEGLASWSPTGSKLAFVVYLANVGEFGDFEVYTMNANGSGRVNLTNDSGSWDFNPSWSPDGGQILYDGDPFGDLDVFSIPSSGGTPDILTLSGDDEWNPDFQPIPAFPLVDARFSTFNVDIQWVYNEGITVGCSSERYCPDSLVTRGQMASFLARALSLPASPIDYFSDDNGTTHEVDINRIAHAGITKGCTATTYCPTANVTRGQMAAFIHRALE